MNTSNTQPDIYKEVLTTVTDKLTIHDIDSTLAYYLTHDALLELHANPEEDIRRIIAKLVKRALRERRYNSNPLNPENLIAEVEENSQRLEDWKSAYKKALETYKTRKPERAETIENDLISKKEISLDFDGVPTEVRYAFLVKRITLLGMDRMAQIAKEFKMTEARIKELLRDGQLKRTLIRVAPDNWERRRNLLGELFNSKSYAKKVHKKLKDQRKLLQAYGLEDESLNEAITALENLPNIFARNQDLPVEEKDAWINKIEASEQAMELIQRYFAIVRHEALTKSKIEMEILPGPIKPPTSP